MVYKLKVYRFDTDKVKKIVDKIGLFTYIITESETSAYSTFELASEKAVAFIRLGAEMQLNSIVNYSK